jgi:hypothetical protein
VHRSRLLHAACPHGSPLSFFINFNPTPGGRSLPPAAPLRFHSRARHSKLCGSVTAGPPGHSHRTVLVSFPAPPTPPFGCATRKSLLHPHTSLSSSRSCPFSYPPSRISSSRDSVLNGAVSQSLCALIFGPLRVAASVGSASAICLSGPDATTLQRPCLTRLHKAPCRPGAANKPLASASGVCHQRHPPGPLQPHPCPASPHPLFALFARLPPGATSFPPRPRNSPPLLLFLLASPHPRNEFSVRRSHCRTDCSATTAQHFPPPQHPSHGHLCPLHASASLPRPSPKSTDTASNVHAGLQVHRNNIHPAHDPVICPLGPRHAARFTV